MLECVRLLHSIILTSVVFSLRCLQAWSILCCILLCCCCMVCLLILHDRFVTVRVHCSVVSLMHCLCGLHFCIVCTCYLYHWSYLCTYDPLVHLSLLEPWPLMVRLVCWFSGPLAWPFCTSGLCLFNGCCCVCRG